MSIFRCLPHSSGWSNSKINRRIFGSGGHAIRGKLMHYAFRDMFGKVKSCRWTGEEFEAMVVGGRATFLLDDHGAFIKDDSSLIGGSFKKAPRFAMKRAPHVELRIAPQRTPHRLDCGLVESVRPVALRRSDGKPSNSRRRAPRYSTSLPSRAKLKKALTNTI
jgi:hypothetical protein